MGLSPPNVYDFFQQMKNTKHRKYIWHQKGGIAVSESMRWGCRGLGWINDLLQTVHTSKSSIWGAKRIPRSLCKSGRSIRSTICLKLQTNKYSFLRCYKNTKVVVQIRAIDYINDLPQTVRTGEYYFWAAKRIPRPFCKTGRSIRSTICLKLCRQVSIIFEVLKEYQDRCANQGDRLHQLSVSNCVNR